MLKADLKIRDAKTFGDENASERQAA